MSKRKLLFPVSLIVVFLVGAVGLRLASSYLVPRLFPSDIDARGNSMVYKPGEVEKQLSGPPAWDGPNQTGPTSVRPKALPAKPYPHEIPVWGTPTSVDGTQPSE